MTRNLGIRLIILLMALLVTACGDTNSGDFVATGNNKNGGGGNPPVANADIILRSELELAKGLDPRISKLTFTTTNSKGQQTAKLEAPKAPEVKVSVPSDSKLLQIEYADSNNNQLFVWGSTVSLAPGETLVISNPVLTEISSITRLVVEPPAPPVTQASGLQLAPIGVSIQLRATATLRDGTTQDVTERVGWASSDPSIISVTSLGGLTGLVADRSADVTASFGSIKSAPLRFSVDRNLRITGVSIQPDPTFPRVDGTPTLSEFGPSGRLKFIALFSDGKTRDVRGVNWVSANPNALSVDSEGTVRCLNANTVSSVGVTASITTTGLGTRTANISLRCVDGFQENVLNKPLLTQASLSGTPLVPGLQALPDLNSDGRADLVACRAGANGADLANPALFLGRGDGTFGTTSSLPIGLTSAAGAKIHMVASDTNGDRVNDLVVATSADTRVAVVRAGSPNPAAVSYLTFPANVESIALGDVNGDGANELFVMTNTGTFFRALGSRTGYSAPTQFTLPGRAARSRTRGDIAVGDINADGFLDFAVADPGPGRTGTTFTLAGQTDGTFAISNEQNFTNPLYSLAFVPTKGFTDAKVRGSSQTPTFQVTRPGNVLGTFALPTGTPQITVGSMSFELGTRRRFATLVSGNIAPLIGENNLGPVGGAGLRTTTFAVGHLNNDGLSDIATVNDGGQTVTTIRFGLDQ